MAVSHCSPVIKIKCLQLKIHDSSFFASFFFGSDSDSNGQVVLSDKRNEYTRHNRISFYYFFDDFFSFFFCNQVLVAHTIKNWKKKCKTQKYVSIDS